MNADKLNIPATTQPSTTVFTEPQELFREIREIDQMILDLIASPEKVSWHWPSYYMLYIDIDKLSWLLQSAGSALSHSFIDGDASTPEANRITQANEICSQIENLVKDITLKLWQSARNVSTKVKDESLRHRIRCHFHPKSDWSAVFWSEYSGGVISPEGSTLSRCILLIDNQPIDRMPDLFAQDVVQHHQVFDLSTASARESLTDAARAAETVHGKAYRAMTNFFLQHCTVQDLVYPSTI